MVNIGVHIVAVKTANNERSDGSIFISISDGEHVHQLEPGMSRREQTWLEGILYDSTQPKVACDIVWHALDLAAYSVLNG